MSYLLLLSIPNPAVQAAEDLGQAVAAYLKANEAVAALVGERVYPVAPASKTPVTPYLVYKIISGVGVYHLGGPTGVRRSRVRVTARTRSFGDAIALREAVRQLDGYRGWFGQIKAEAVEFADAEDAFDEPLEGADVGTYERKFDLIVRHRESMPAN